MFRAGSLTSSTGRSAGFHLARLYSVPFQHSQTSRGHVGDSTHLASAREREGFLDTHTRKSEIPLRQALQTFAAEPKERARLTRLPGVEFESQLPADPITRLFFQRKGDNALYEGEYDSPNLIDHDRIALAKRDYTRTGQTRDAVYDFCHRLREASQMKKRFAVVSADQETARIAEVLYDHGFIAGFRDFNNKRAFAVELKYFQNESVLQQIIPVSMDAEVEFELSPKMLRRFMAAFGTQNKIRVYIIKTWDGRVMDHFQAVKEGLGGKGLALVY
jgi:ribosomal protein S8